MNDEECSLSDLEGYLVVRNALSPGEVAEINHIADDSKRAKTGILARRL